MTDYRKAIRAKFYTLEPVEQWGLLCAMVASVVAREFFGLWLNCVGGTGGTDAEWKASQGLVLLAIFREVESEKIISMLNYALDNWDNLD